MPSPTDVRLTPLPHQDTLVCRCGVVVLTCPCEDASPTVRVVEACGSCTAPGGIPVPDEEE